MVDMQKEVEILIKEITPNELEEPLKSMAVRVGMETAFNLTLEYGGKAQYFPKPEAFFKGLIKAKIRKEYAKGKISERKLAEKYGISRSTVHNWINQ